MIYEAERPKQGERVTWRKVWPSPFAPSMRAAVRAFADWIDRRLADRWAEPDEHDADELEDEPDEAPPLALAISVTPPLVPTPCVTAPIIVIVHGFGRDARPMVASFLFTLVESHAAFSERRELPGFANVLKVELSVYGADVIARIVEDGPDGQTPAQG